MQKPILFQPDMVAAILAGAKTQTRRILKHSTENKGPYNPAYLEAHKNAPGWATICPYGTPGGSLWVRETFYAWGRWERRWNDKKSRDEWHFIDETLDAGKGYYYLDAPPPGYSRSEKKTRGDSRSTWWRRPSIFMPRAACRIQLKISGIRIQQLQEISEGDSLAEGIRMAENREPPNQDIEGQGFSHGIAVGFSSAKSAYEWLWKKINGKESWAKNPWVWVISFNRVTA